MKTARLHVALRGVEPAVARVIDVPATATLPELHELSQAAIGWTDSHLHQFVTREATYGVDFPGADVWPEDQRDETTARLADLGNQFEYLYDFGDGWTHDVEVVGTGGPVPGCVDGYGACPPEDCGGPGGYAQLLKTLADPNHPDHENMRSRVGNRLRPFDRTVADRWVQRPVGEVPESVRLLLDLTAEGVKLTPGGRLPRTLARSIQEHRPHWHPLGTPAATEDDLKPLAPLHHLLRRVGLLRLRHGVLAPTRATGDDLDMVRRLRSAFEPNTFPTEITDLTIAVLAAHGPLPLSQLAAQVYQLLGRGWQCDGEPLTENDVCIAIAQHSLIMSELDLIDETNWRLWAIGTSGLSLLPRATMLAQIWSGDT